MRFQILFFVSGLIVALLCGCDDDTSSFTESVVVTNTAVPVELPTIAPTQTPEVSEIPTLINHSSWTYGNDDSTERLWEVIRCEADDEYLDEEYCDEVEDACSRLSNRYGGWGDPSYAVIACELVDLQAGEGEYLYKQYSEGLGVPFALGVGSESEAKLIRSLDELTDFFKPIESPYEALLYAQLYTNLSPRNFSVLPHQSSEDVLITYHTDTIEDTHVVTTDEGYKVLLFDEEGICITYLYQSRLVTVKKDGTVIGGTPKKLYTWENGPCE